MSLKSLSFPSPAPFRGSAWIGTVLRLAVGVVLLISSIPKLEAPRSFKQTVRAYDFSPEWLSKIIGYGLPVLLFVLGVILILGMVTRWIALLAAVVLFVLAIAVIQAAARGLHVSSGLFGVGGVTPSPSWGLPVFIVLLLLAGAIFVVLWPDTRLAIDDYLARNDWVEPPSAKRMRDPQGRAKYEREVAAKERAATVRNRFLGISVAVLTVVVTLVGAAVLRSNAEFRDVSAVSAVSPLHGVTYGKDAAATVEVYTDLFSPAATQFANSIKDLVAKDVPANRAQLRFHLVAALDHSTDRSGYSTRAANAALCAADVSADFFVKYHNVLVGTDKSGKLVRPTSQSDRSVADFVRYATEVGGLTSDQQTTFRDCVQAENHKDVVAQLTESASKAGVGLTPVVYLNGSRLSSPSVASVTAAIAAADAKGPAPDPSPSPTTSGTAKPSATPTGAAKSGMTSPAPVPTATGSPAAS